MPEVTKTLAEPGDNQLPVAGAEQQLARLCRSAAASNGEIACAVQIAAAAVMTGAGAGLRLFAQPGAARLVAAACALVVAARIVLPVAVRWATGEADEPGWAAAAAVHRGSLPGRIPAATLAVVDRYLPVLSQGYRSAHLYVGPCAGAGRHTRVCSSVGLLAPPPGRRHRLLIVGEHMAMEPAMVAASLAHEAGHVRGWTYRAFVQLQHLRQAGWGWAVAGLVGGSWGWLGVLVAAAVFQASSLMLVWAVEVICDRAAMRTVGQVGYRAALSRLLVMSAGYRGQRSRPMRVIRFVLCWLAGPSHPPLALRRALIRGSRPVLSSRTPKHGSGKDRSHIGDLG